MSMLMSLTEASSSLLTDPVMTSVASGDGILDWVNTKSSQATTTVRTVAALLAIIFVIVAAVVSRMAMARVLIAGIAAGLFVWIVFNVTDIKDRVDSEINASAAVTVVVAGPLADVNDQQL